MPNLLNELTHYVRPRVAIRAVPTATAGPGWSVVRVGRRASGAAPVPVAGLSFIIGAKIPEVPYVVSRWRSRGRDRPCCDTRSHVVSELVEEVRHMSKT